MSVSRDAMLRATRPHQKVAGYGGYGGYSHGEKDFLYPPPK